MTRARVFAWTIAVSVVALRASGSRACELHLNGATLSGAASALPTAPPAAGFSSTSFSLNVPIYHSLPNATAKVYLDFDGDFTATWGDYSPGFTPAYSIDTDLTSFSAQELSNIHQIWMRVSEKFSPWNIDVTTEDPGNRNDRETMQVVIGGEGRNASGGYWPGVRAGGVSYVGSFSGSYPNSVFVFPGNLSNGDPKSVSEASAHETGHSFGLLHQGLFDADGNLVNEYNPGNALKAPIMGRSYDSARGLWWLGPSLAPNVIQDDYAQIGSSANGFFLRADDHGDTPASATPLLPNGNSIAAAGVITLLFPNFGIIDKDFFSFETDAGDVSFSLDVAPFGPMLDASLLIYDASGLLIAQSVTPSLGESLQLTLAAGSYYLAVTSAGNYGDIGQYFLSGTIVAVPEPSALAIITVSLLAIPRRARRG